MLAALSVVAWRLTAFKLARQPLFIDFLAMWTGGRAAHARPASAYDFAAIDRAQAWLLGAGVHDRPFPYPPGALLIFEPLGRWPFWAAAWTWILLTGAAFAVVIWSLLPRPRGLGLGLVALTPGVVWAAFSGQIAFLIGALAIGGVALLRRRPLLAGALIGLAAAIKPTVLIMAPVALIAGGHWRALLASGVAGLAVILASAAVLGTAPWFAWIAVAPSYLAHITHNPRFFTSIVAPGGLAAQLGVDGLGLTLWRGAFALLGLAVVILVFRRTGELAPRLTALFGASLLASPYAMNYETTLLAPGAVLALLAAPAERAAWFSLAAFIGLAVAGFPGVSAAAFLAFLALALGPTLVAGRRDAASSREAAPVP